MADTCANCRSYFPVVGECHRFPPTVIVGSQLFPSWPLIHADDWCAEWQAGGSGGTTTPTLTSLTPNTLPSGSTPATVDVVGTNFDSSCVVLADGQSRATFYVTATHLQYTARPDLSKHSSDNRRVSDQRHVQRPPVHVHMTHPNPTPEPPTEPSHPPTIPDPDAS
jgi:hypothetical protein